MKRRSLIQAMAALSLVGKKAVAATPHRHLIVVILRGGMDGLAAVPPLGDKNLSKIRKFAAYVFFQS